MEDLGGLGHLWLPTEVAWDSDAMVRRPRVRRGLLAWSRVGV